MNADDLMDLGAGILADVSDAVSKGEYTNLGKNIQERISETIPTERDSEYWQRYREKYNITNDGLSRQNTASGVTAAGAKRSGSTAGGKGTAQAVSDMVKDQTDWVMSEMKQSGKTIGRWGLKLKALGKIWVGITLVIIFSPLALTSLLVASDTFLMNLFFFVIFGLLDVGSIMLLRSGLRTNHLLRDVTQVENFVKGLDYISIEQLATLLRKSEKDTRKAVNQLLGAGLLQGQMDKQETTLLLTQKAYAEYRDALFSQKEREAKEKEEAIKAAGADGEYAGYSEDVAGILKEGNAYIKQVREYNDEIPDTEEMSNKLYRLEDTMNRIFDVVRKKPEKSRDLRKFMNYYIPTTMKLLGTYVELCEHGEGENVSQSKQEIEKATDMINDAFEALLDDLFEETAWDVASDIDVMKTMMEQDGLTKEKELVH